MKKVAVLSNQTLYDLAVQHYGTVEATGELFALNPDIRNTPEREDFCFDLPIQPGEIVMNEESRLIKKNRVKELSDKEITTWQEL
ncbi:hypothetical protein EZS27_012234 [termite gut metagenome]|uniref:LysM domain-containing protein n=1 Tax=termite gut metagenome TaxID=433724 RepID=A0A5J4S192_9ZZZZ